MTSAAVTMMCDRPMCTCAPTWFIGRVGDELDLGRGHLTCDEHLAEAAYVTYRQTQAEGYTKTLVIVPAAAIYS